MCLAVRKTVRRGFSTVPDIFLRMRSLRRSRPTILIAMAKISYGLLGRLAALAGLARLLADLLALVANALAAVGLRRTEAADFGGRLAHELLVGAREVHDRALRVTRDLALDARGEREDDRVREAERH